MFTKTDHIQRYKASYKQIQRLKSYRYRPHSLSTMFLRQEKNNKNITTQMLYIRTIRKIGFDNLQGKKRYNQDQNAF